jgi:hypothetical protein
MLKDVTTAVKGNKTVMLIIGIVVMIIIIAVIYNVYKGVKSGSRAIGNTLGDAAIAAQTGLSVARVEAIRQDANNLWKNSVHFLFGIFSYFRTVDGNDFVASINGKQSDKEVALLDELYNEISKESIAHTLKDVIPASLYIDKIKPSYWAILNH